MNPGDKEAEKKFKEAEQKIADARQDVKDIKKGKWYVLNREKMQSYVEYGQEADRIAALGRVVPVIFFLVAALVSLTAMTRRRAENTDRYDESIGIQWSSYCNEICDLCPCSNA